MPHSRPSWNSYLTDADQFKLTKQEILKKKKMLVSKHNILLNGGNVPMKPKPRRVKKTLKKDENDKVARKVSTSNSSKRSNRSSGPTSLDLLGYDDESADDNSSKDSFCSPVKSVTSVRAIQRKSNGPSSVQRVDLSKRVSPSKPKQNIGVQSHKQHQNRANESLNLPSHEMSEISSLISTLNSELRYYEQVSGRRSAIDVEELEMVVGSAMGDGSGEDLRPSSVLRYLVQLVCQTMTYLLQSEVDAQKQRDKYSDLEMKVDKLAVLVSSVQSQSHATLVKPHFPLDFFNAAAEKGTPTTPVHTPSASTRRTVDSDRTVDLYGSSPASTPRSVYSTTSTPADSDSSPHTEEFAFSTPELSARPPADSAEESPRPSTDSSLRQRQHSHHHVSFSLPEEDTSPHQQTPRSHGEESSVTSTPMRAGGDLSGSSASDWLFAPAASLAASFGSAAQQIDASSSPAGSVRARTMDDDSEVSDGGGRPSTLPAGSARVLELQRQLAILRHERDSSGASRDTTQPSTARADPLRQWMRWQGQQASPSSVRVPTAAPEDHSLTSYVDEGRAHAADVSVQMTRNQQSEHTYYHRTQDRAEDELRVSMEGEEEGVSFSAIPSHMVPTPERAPRHPFTVTGSSESSTAGRPSSSVGTGVSSFVRGYTYDARSGSYGS